MSHSAIVRDRNRLEDLIDGAGVSFLALSACPRGPLCLRHVIGTFENLCPPARASALALLAQALPDSNQRADVV